MTDFARPGHLAGGVEQSVAPSNTERPASAEDSARFSEIFRSHADFVWRALIRHGVRRADAEDATQEVFLVVHRKLSAYEERGTLRAWLFAIARQVASHYRRSEARIERKTEALMHAAPAKVDPHDAAERAEAAALVRAFLDGLDDAHAAVFYLAEVEGLTAPEVATATDTNLNTVYGRLRVARRRFEEMLSRRP